MMDWFPVVFLTFKVLVIGTGMYFAVKWHYEQGKMEKGAAIRAGGKVAVVFLLSLLGLGLVTFLLVRMLGLELTYP